MSVAEVAGLTVTITGRDGAPVHALRGVDLTIERGEIVALVGESGSGKSVLGSSLLGLLPQARSVEVSGSVTVAGHDVLRGTRSIRRAVRRHLLGAVFQDPMTALNPTMRVGRQLRERGLRAARAEAALREVGVPEAAARLRAWPHELSGGLRQRVTLAMALGAEGRLPGGDGHAHDGHARDGLAGDAGAGATGEGGAPLLVVADEPTTALDVSVQAQVVLLLDRIRREHGCSVLLVTHDLGVAASIADRMVVLYGGRVLESGQASALVGSPRHPYTAGLLRARLSLAGDEAPVAIPGAPPDARDPLPGCGFAPRCRAADDRCRTAVPPTVDGVACFHPLPPPASPAPGPGAAVAVRAPGTEPAPAARPALELVAVHKAFPVGDRMLRAVDGVDLTLTRGGAVGLVGESGCGKTTLLRVATGLLAADSGIVDWHGARPQLVFQDAGASLTPWLRIGTQVEERLVARGRPREDAAELLELVGLDGRAARARPRELSGGQRQRAAIARALASGPEVLVCDEPVSALDASLAVRVLDLLARLREELGLALLVVTHDLAAARYIADDVAVMYLGRIVERGPAPELFTFPMHPYTRGLLAACPTTEVGRLAPSLSGEPPSPMATREGCAFRGRCPDAVAACSAEPLLRARGPRRAVACHLAAG